MCCVCVCVYALCVCVDVCVCRSVYLWPRRQWLSNLFHGNPLKYVQYTYSSVPPKFTTHTHVPQSQSTHTLTCRHRNQHTHVPPSQSTHTHSHLSPSQSTHTHSRAAITINTHTHVLPQQTNRVSQNRIYTPYLTINLVISLPKIPYTHRIYMVLANPTSKALAHTPAASAVCASHHQLH